MKTSYSTLEIAALLHATKMTVTRWAKAEDWGGEKRQGKGGGIVWFVSSLPQERVTALATALAGVVYSKQCAAPVNARTGTSQSLAGIPEHGQKKASARAYVVAAVKQIHAATGKAISDIQFAFTEQYRAKKADVPTWVYEALPKVSRCSIRGWMVKLEQGGVRLLAKQQEKRPPRNTVAKSPSLEQFLVGMLEEYPHVTAVMLHKAASTRFGKGGKAEALGVRVPSLRRMQVWLKEWKAENAMLYTYMTNPDAAKSKYKAAYGDAAAHVLRLNQEWQTDSTVCDLMLADGKRHCIISMIDVYSRRLRFHVSRTSTAAAVASCYRKALLEWGINEELKTDNGADYVSQHIQRIVAQLEVVHTVCPPFSPEKKPHVERAFKTFLHSHVEVMQGFLGHSVAERIDIEARKSFAERLYKKLKTKEATVQLAVTPEELQKICDDWTLAVYGDSPHSGLDGQTPNERASSYAGEVARIEDVRALDVLLLPCPGGHGTRKVGKKGIRITSRVHGLDIKGSYFNSDMAALAGRTVLVRMDDTDLGRVYLFDPATHVYLGKGEHPGLLGWSTDDVRQVAVAAGRTQKAVVAKQRKATRAAARAADVKDIAQEILQVAVARHAAQQPARPEQVIAYTNAQLEQAARTFTGDFTPPSEAKQQKAQADLAHLMQKDTGFTVPTGPQERMECWRGLYDKAASGATLTPDEARWFASFSQSYECRAYCQLHGLALEK